AAAQTARRAGRQRSANCSHGRACLMAAVDLAEPLQSQAPLAPGYTVVDHLCRNEATDIYDVWSDERTCRCVAKVVRPDRLREERPRERLLREGRLLQAFTHPHLVRAYETFE